MKNMNDGFYTTPHLQSDLQPALLFAPKKPPLCHQDDDGPYVGTKTGQGGHGSGALIGIDIQQKGTDVVMEQKRTKKGISN